MKITETIKSEPKKQMELDNSMDWLIACVWAKPKPDLRRNSEGKAEWGMYGAEGWRVAIIQAWALIKVKLFQLII